MKRKCKQVSIEDRGLIEAAVLECLRKAKKRRRGDTRRLFARLLGVSPAVAARALKKRSKLYHEGVQKVVDMLQERIRTRRLDLRPIYQQRRRDNSSGKTRLISILSIEQLMLDHVAVAGLRELAGRVGEYQVSSIKGRGSKLGKKAIEKWLRGTGCRYAVKMDIRDFYGSINRPMLLAWMYKRVANRPLMWLVGQLVYTSPRGLAIGSFLSQTLANIYLSDLYHAAMERCVSKRGKRQVRHALFQMDDIYMASNNSRQLRYAAYAIMKQAGERGLQVKNNWHVFRVEGKRPVDLMGYRFSRNCTTLRKYIFKRLRRSVIRTRRAMRKGYPMSFHRAQRMASYYGYIIHTNSRAFCARLNAIFLYQQSFKRLKHEKKQIRSRAGTRQRTALHEPA